MSKQWKNDLQALYRSSRQESPPAELDQKIRLAAHQAIQRKTPNLKWYLSSAAVVLLAVNVVLFTYVPEPEMTEKPWQSLSAPASKAAPQPMPKWMAHPAPEIDSEVDILSSRDSMQEQMQSMPELQSHESLEPTAPPGLIGNYEDTQQFESFRSLQTQKKSQQADNAEQGGGIRLPQKLPFDLNSLLAGHEGLTGEQSNDSLEIRRNNKPVLTMKRVKQGILIEAYQGAHLWDVYAEWGQSSKGALNCSLEKYLICDLTDKVQGGFENEALIFIRWLQRNAY